MTIIHQISVLPNHQVLKERKKEPWIFISNTHTNKIQVNHHLVMLNFQDITPEDLDIKEFSHLHPFLFNLDYKKMIYQFLDHYEIIDRLFVSCDVGYSRSPAIANALIQQYNVQQSLLLPPNYYPNPWVYSMMF